MLFQIAGVGVTAPTWLVAEGLVVYSALEWFDHDIVRVGLLLAALVLFMVGFAALAVGYMLRDAR